MDTPQQFQEWQLRLIEERSELMNRTIKLKKMMDSPDTKLSFREWDMMQEQFRAMRNYLQVLTERCKYYNLIESEDLGILY